MSGGFISVCSGIEAVSEAWRDLPLGPILYSEIENFPRNVLMHRHAARAVQSGLASGAVPLWGDFTAIRIRHLLRLGVDLESVEILVGGTPCQSFSMAGLRRGLADDRGNLSLEFIRLANAIDNFRQSRGLAPLIIVWENVEGVLTDNANAFGCFLAAMVGGDSPLVPPSAKRDVGRWTSAGLVDGSRRAAAWRLFDAQYFGLAQRRRRVLVVASARKECVPKILFESEGVRRDSPPRRDEGKRVAGTFGARASGGGGFGTDFEIDGGLVRSDEAEPQAFGGGNTSGSVDIAASLTTKGGQRQDFESETFVAHTLRGEGFDASEDGTGRGTPLVPVSEPIPLQGSGAYGANGAGIGAAGNPSFALDTKGAQAVAYRITGNDGAYDSGDVSGALGTQTDRSAHVVAFAENSRAEVRLQGGDGAIAGALSRGGGKPGQGMPAVAVSIRGREGGGDKAHALYETGVRRLTPRECERLQGFRDNYTLIPYRGGMVADGPRYKAIGNSMPVPLMRWIGERVSLALDEWGAA